MIRLPDGTLDPSAVSHLKTLQKQVDGKATYAEQVAHSKDLWDARRNKAADKACFEQVSETLYDLSGEQKLCAYCELSLGDEIEHIKPKDLYPDLVFQWTNYLFACGPCNSRKNNRYAVLDASGTVVTVTRGRKDPVVPPVQGEDAFINPRTEDPMDFFRMDLLGTFALRPKDRANDPDPAARRRYDRAMTTLEYLQLETGTHGHLVPARRQAFNNFRARLKEIAAEQHAGERNRLILEFRKLSHWSVWLEIKRTRPDEFKSLFQAVPEAETW